MQCTQRTCAARSEVAGVFNEAALHPRGHHAVICVGWNAVEQRRQPNSGVQRRDPLLAKESNVIQPLGARESFMDRLRTSW